MPDRLLHLYHPGFAWALKRSTFKRLGGFYNHSIIGNGDTMFTLNFFKNHLPHSWINDIEAHFITSDWDRYHQNFREVNPTIGYLRARALHLFHGIKENRQYASRYKAVAHILKGKWEDQITTNKDGLYEFKNPEINPLMLRYFKGRNEDIPLAKASAIVEMQRRRTRRVRHRR
jgi:hypothetical protein